MTMIMMHDRYMACDSRVISGSFVMTDTAVQRKITRAPDGSLVGCMGSMTYCHHIFDLDHPELDP